MAGSVVEFESGEGAPGMSFATVRGAGHEVPKHRPVAGLAIARALVEGEGLPEVGDEPGGLRRLEIQHRLCGNKAAI